MDRRDLYCRGKEEYPTSHIRVSGLLWGSVEGYFLSSRIAKGIQDGRRVPSGENIKADEESSLCEMAGISRQIQQLGECERSRVIFHVIVLLLFVSGLSLLVFLMDKAETLSFGEDYINSTVATLHSV